MRDGWPQCYILVDRTPIAVDMMTWGKWLATDDRRVAETTVDDTCFVSTIFLGLDHNHGRGDPILFETMIFGGPLNEWQQRYRTYADAERGHEEAVVEARKALAQVDAIARASGAKADVR